MLKIAKEYQDEYIVYHFSESTKINDMDKIEEMMYEDIRNTYVFVLDFESVKRIDANAIIALKKLYRTIVKNACEIVISGLQIQPALMMELLKVNKLYTVYPNLQMTLENIKGRDNAFYHY